MAYLSWKRVATAFVKSLAPDAPADLLPKAYDLYDAKVLQEKLRKEASEEKTFSLDPSSQSL